MLRNILIGIFAVVIICVGYWGYQEHQEKNAILIQAENNYQRAFHDLTYQVDLLHDQIGTVLAINSRDQQAKNLTEVWRITSNAQADVGQLPLALLPFNKTEEFLSNIGEFSYRVGVRNLDKEPLSKEEYKALQTLYKNAADIQNELRTVQHKVISNGLRWMDVELALASDDKKMDNTIVDGFQTVEKNVSAFTEANFGPTFGQVSEKRDKGFPKLKGIEISPSEARQMAIKFLELPSNTKVDVTESGDGSDFDFYSLVINHPEFKTDIFMDMTKVGGHPIWVLQNRDVLKTNLSLNDAANKAASYLKKRGYKNMNLLESTQYDNVGVFTFVSVDNNIWIYPEMVQMKVALDNGDIIGYSAKEFLKSHKERNIPKPTLSMEDAKKKVNPNVKIQENRLVIVENEFGKEELAYEFLGVIDDSSYRIFISAFNGNEIQIEKLNEAEPIYNQM